MTFELWPAFLEEWNLRPPVHWIAAAYVGHKPKGSKAGRAVTEPTQSFLSEFRDGIIK